MKRLAILGIALLLLTGTPVLWHPVTAGQQAYVPQGPNFGNDGPGPGGGDHDGDADDLSIYAAPADPHVDIVREDRDRPDTDGTRRRALLREKFWHWVLFCRLRVPW